MATLPTPGSSSGTWGTELNAWLGVGHNASGASVSSIPVFNVKDDAYGAKGNGIADDTAAIQAAIDACGAAGGGTVFIPVGTYNISSTLNMTLGGVHLIGAGWAQTAGGAGGYPPDVKPSTLFWTGGSTTAAKMLSAFNVGDISIERLTLDGNAKATYGLYLVRINTCVFSKITIKGMQRNGNSGGTIDSVGIYAAGDATSISPFNTFEDLYIKAATCLWLDGDVGGNDVTESVFNRVWMSYGSITGNAIGCEFRMADGNTFSHFYEFRDWGTGVGYHFGNNFRANRFFGFFPGTGVTVDTPNAAGFSNLILGYSTQDGAPRPDLSASGSMLDWIDASVGSGFKGWYSGSRVLQPLATLAYSASITPDASLATYQTITVTNATPFTINAPTNPPLTGFSQSLTIEIFNNTAGALGALTWNGIYKGVGAYAQPGAGLKTFVQFTWNGSAWIRQGQINLTY